MGTKRFILDYFLEQREITSEISVVDIDRVINLLYGTWEFRRQIFTCGNGGSASTASHFACDLAKSTIVDGKHRFKVRCLNDNVPLVSAITNDNGFASLYEEQLIGQFEQGDVLVCFSVHGGAGRDKGEMWSQNLLKAMRLAQALGGVTIGFSGCGGGPMKEIADVCIVVPSDSTPHVESFHLTLEHLICACLKERIKEGV